MRFLFLGDIVGSPGVEAVRKRLPELRKRESLDFVVANAENATNGSGLTPRDYRTLRTAGVDAMTLGDHIYKKFEIADILRNPEEPICKPANYPTASAGRDFCVTTDKNGKSLVVISLLGRTFMRPVDCPFSAIDRVLESLDRTKYPAVLVDIHAEATADKYLIAHHLKGRVTAVLGTHTHVATADEQLFPGGTAFQCDVGMTGPHDGVLGRRVDKVMRTTLRFEPTTFDVSDGDIRLSGAIVDFDELGKATAIRRLSEPA